MVQHEVYDVAIVGGGLAGLSLAIQCGQKGYKVLLFEKEQYPFHKVCGEYISLESWDFLIRLGVPLQQLGLPVIKTLQASDVSGTVYEFPLPLGGFGVSRYLLDNILYELALKKNVHVLTGCKVDEVVFANDQFLLSVSGRSYHAAIVCGSYGKRSNLDIKMKRPFILKKPSALNNYIGVKYHVTYPQPSNIISLHNFKNGYCGISNIENGKCCVCYLTTAKNLRDHGNSITTMEQQLLSTNPRLKQIFTKSEFLYDEPVTISGISFSKKAQVENHMLMLGDAAGMIAPLCGNGMSMALHSARIAYENITLFLEKAISRDKLEVRYTTCWQHQFSRRLQVGRVVQQLFGANQSTKIFLKTMSKFPKLATAIISLTHGKAL